MASLIVQIDEHVRRVGLLREALVRSVHLGGPRDGIPEVAHDIIDETPHPAKSEIAALLLSACRWSELQTIDWAYVKEHGKGYVTESKTESRRIFHLPRDVTARDWDLVEPPVHLPHCTRRRAAKALKKALSANGLRPPEGAKAGVHVTRHLIASGMHWHGRSADEIQHRLGHQEITTTAEYIRDIEEWRPH